MTLPGPVCSLPLSFFMQITFLKHRGFHIWYMLSGLEEVTFPELIFNEQFQHSNVVENISLRCTCIGILPCIFLFIDYMTFSKLFEHWKPLFLPKNEVFNICVLDLKYFKIKLTSWVEPRLVQIVSQLQSWWLLLFLFLFIHSSVSCFKISLNFFKHKQRSFWLGLRWWNVITGGLTVYCAT